MNKTYWTMPDGKQSTIFELTDGIITAHISDFGATIHRLYVPDAKGNMDDVVLGFETPAEYIASTTFFGTVVGRSCNRLQGGKFTLNGKSYQLDLNDGNNNLHCGYGFYKDRLWTVEQVSENAITLRLDSPDGDQGFPGNATIKVTYTLEGGALKIAYEGVCDQDTVFNLTNHSYFNLAGHTKPEKAMGQWLQLPARFFTPDDAESIPTGEERPVEGTPFDFRTAKPIGRDINEDYDALKLQGGYDHNFEVWCNPCAVLHDPESGRTMEVTTDCCGIQFYAGNFLEGEKGKDGARYNYRGAVCLETQFFPNALNNPAWKQPITKAGETYRSVTVYTFK